MLYCPQSTLTRVWEGLGVHTVIIKAVVVRHLVHLC